MTFARAPFRVFRVFRGENSALRALCALCGKRLPALGIFRGGGFQWLEGVARGLLSAVARSRMSVFEGVRRFLDGRVFVCRWGCDG